MANVRRGAWLLGGLAALAALAFAQDDEGPSINEMRLLYQTAVSDACNQIERDANGFQAHADVWGLGEGAMGDGSTISREEVDRIVRAQAGDIQTCYDAARQAWPGLKGEMRFRFVVDPEGHVIAAVPVENSTGVGAFGCCVASVVRQLRFEGSGEHQEVFHPFRFGVK